MHPAPQKYTSPTCSEAGLTATSMPQTGSTATAARTVSATARRARRGREDTMPAQIDSAISPAERAPMSSPAGA
jgi:hypothetical protein